MKLDPRNLNSNRIFVVIPRFFIVGGAENALRDYIKNSIYEFFLLELYTLKFYKYDRVNDVYKRLSLVSIFQYQFSHTFYFFWQMGLFSTFLKTFSNHKLIFFVSSTSLYKGIKYYLFKLSLKNSDVVITDGEDSFSYINSLNIKKKTVLCGIGINKTELSSFKSQVKENELKIVFVSRWSKEKGIQYIKNFSDSLLRSLVIVTDTPNQAKLMYPFVEVVDGNLRNNVLNHISSAHFLINLSDVEGAAIAAQEALYFDCIPIFRCDHEIGNAIKNILNSNYENIIGNISLETYNYLISSNSKQIIKPVDSSGSRGVFVIDNNRSDLMNQIKMAFEFSYSNEIIIDEKFLNGIQDYGVFYIYHYSKKNIIDSVISNRCYLGYSYQKNLYSFVHGNCYARYYNFANNKISSNLIKTSLFKNHYYKIQKYFYDYDFLELFFANPTTKTIYFSIGNFNFKIKSGCSKIIKLKDQQSIIIKSNCMFLRPTIFQYKNNYLDTHHS